MAKRWQTNGAQMANRWQIDGKPMANRWQTDGKTVATPRQITTNQRPSRTHVGKPTANRRQPMVHRWQAHCEPIANRWPGHGKGRANHSPSAHEPSELANQCQNHGKQRADGKAPATQRQSTAIAHRWHHTFPGESQNQRMATSSLPGHFKAQPTVLASTRPPPCGRAS